MMDEFKAAKAVVTGGAGFVGSHIAEMLVREGSNVVILDIKPFEQATNIHPFLHKVTYVKGDVCDGLLLDEVFRGTTFVFHEAALSRVQDSIEHPLKTHHVNVGGTLALLEAARKAQVERVIFASSAAVYGDQTKLPVSEAVPVFPKSPYALHKYIGEQYCRLWSELYNLETISLRYFNVYGPRFDPEGDYALVVGKFLKQWREDEPLTVTGDGEQTRDFIHVRDVARANLLAAASKGVGPGEIINIGTGQRKSVNELARLIGGAITHLPPRVEPRHSEADIEKARKLLDWMPEESFEEGVGELKQLFGV